MRAEEAIKRYERELRVTQGCADNTVRSYLGELESFRNFLELRGRRLVYAERADIVDFKESIAGSRMARGVAQAMKSIRSFFSFCLDANIISASPVPQNLRVPVKHQEPTDVPTAAQFLEIRARVRKPQTDPRAVPALTREAIFETLAGSGLRIEALLTLKPRHLRLGARPHIMVEAETMSCKGNAAGEVPITHHAAQVLASYITANPRGFDDILFNVSASVIRKILGEVEPQGLNLKPHSLRHFYGSMTYFKNLDGGKNDVVWVRDAMGHASISTTNNYLKMARRVCQSDAEWTAWTTGVELAVKEMHA